MKVPVKKHFDKKKRREIKVAKRTRVTPKFDGGTDN